MITSKYKGEDMSYSNQFTINKMNQLCQGGGFIHSLQTKCGRPGIQIRRDEDKGRNETPKIL